MDIVCEAHCAGSNLDDDLGQLGQDEPASG